MLVMGIDMGTTGSKAVVFDENWNVVSSAYREYNLIFPGENRLELDFELVWRMIKEAVIEANAKANSGRVGALAISAIGDVVIPLDVDGIPVRMAIVDFDTRGTDEIKEFALSFGAKKLFEITGMPPLFINSLSKILWIKNNEPEIYNKVKRWATVEDYILQKMGIKPVASYSIAARTMLFDIRESAWAEEILNEVGIDANMLPEVAPSGVVVGELRDGFAADLGFKGSVKICSGGHDMVCAAIGAGLTVKESGTAVDIDGTIEGIVVAMEEANTGDEMFKNFYPCYQSYEGYVTFSVNLTASCVQKWFRDELSREVRLEAERQGTNSYELMLQGIDPSTPGKIIFIPQFSGSGNPYFDANAKGMVYGLTLDSTRSDMIKGLMEGLCYEIKMHLDGFEGAGIKIKKLICVGGGSRSKLKLQLKANITGLEIESLDINEASALGAAVLAAKAVGVVDDPNKVIRNVLSVKEMYKPSIDDRSSFAESYRKYKILNEIKHRFENNY